METEKDAPSYEANGARASPEPIPELIVARRSQRRRTQESVVKNYREKQKQQAAITVPYSLPPSVEPDLLVTPFISPLFGLWRMKHFPSHPPGLPPFTTIPPSPGLPVTIPLPLLAFH